MECYGIMIGKSERFQLAPLKEKMRCLTTTRGGAVMKVDGKEVRIRLLTPKEYWRLMGVKDEDYDKVRPKQSRSKLYHLAGDSIVTTCLMALFGQMLDVDWEEKIREVTK